MATIDRAGCRLYFEQEGNGPAIVFAHGAGGNHLSWWQQAPEFRDQYQCVVLDQRGFGRSEVQEGGVAPGPEAFVDDLAAVLDHLAIERTALVAQSMGGWTCLGLALRDPERVAALVMADTVGGVSNEVIAEAQAPGREQRRAQGSLRGLAYAPRLREERPELAFLYDQISGLNRPLDEILPNGLGTRPAEDLAALQTPTLWVVGAEDPLTPPAAIREAHRLTPGSEYFEVAETGHSVYFERAVQFNARVRKFLSDQGWG